MTRSRTDRSWAEEVALPATALGLAVGAVVVLELASVATGVLSGAGRLLLVGFDDLAELLRSWLGAPLSADSAVGHLTEHSALFVTCVVVAVLGLVGLAVVARVWWAKRWAPAPPGHASWEQISAEFSEAAVRRSAARTRPSMSSAELRGATATELGFPLYHYRNRPLYGAFVNLTGTLAPTQSGKSRKDLVHKVLDAPGAMLCSTTKLDLVEFAALSRSRRSLAGPVIVYDATGRLRWPAPLRWSLIDGCQDQQEASRRAYTLVEAAALRVEAGGGGGAGNDRVFRERAVVVLTAYLVAAAVSDSSVDTIRAWATEPPEPGAPSAPPSQAGGRVAAPPPRPARRLPADPRPIEILREAGRAEMAANLRAEMDLDPRTASAVWMSVRRVVGAWTDPRVRDLLSPARGRGLDVRRFIGQGGSLFLIADQQQAAEAVPVLTALAEHFLRTAQDMAMDYPARRADPPVTVVFDELANGTPVPRLAEVISDAAGRGVVIHWAAQSLAQLERLFGSVGEREVRDNTTTLTAWGGIKDDRTLQWLSDICGTYERTRRQSQADGLLGRERHSYSTETVPVMRPGQIRELPAGQVLALHRGVRCFVAAAVDVTKRPDSAQIDVDVATLRDGTAIPIDDRGYRTGSPHSERRT
ncbi:type IV secretory system conjugative DNA transfer family protein [Pseudonocardia kongjuensis]